MNPYRYDIGYGDNMMGWGNGWFGFILSLLFIAAVAAIAFYLIRTLSAHQRQNSNRRDPLDIARERYAKGEITAEQLADIRKELVK